MEFSEGELWWGAGKFEFATAGRDPLSCTFTQSKILYLTLSWLNL